jgi:adenylate kinase
VKLLFFPSPVKPVKIGITGTPGTGKSTVSRELEGKVVDLSEYVREENIGEKNEKGEMEVDVEELKRKAPEESEDQDLILEGHLAHFLDLDYCIVLRTRPDVLEERLGERDYSSEKVRENLESQKLDLILSQAVENQEKVYEIDTTDKSVEEVAEEIRLAIEEKKERYGVVDWTGFL